jgi:hypothetical protein
MKYYIFLESCSEEGKDAFMEILKDWCNKRYKITLIHKKGKIIIR